MAVPEKLSIPDPRRSLCGKHLHHVFERTACRTGRLAQSHSDVFHLSCGLVVLTIRFGTEHRFQTTPLDYLMVFLAVVIPALPELQVGDVHLGLLASKLIVLFFSFELLLHVFSQRITQLGLVSLWLLFGLAVRAWL